MSLEIEVMTIGQVYAERAFEVKHMQPGRVLRVPVNVFLIKGLSMGPVLVDTGFRKPEIMETIGMRATVSEHEHLENQLARRGIAFGDIPYVIHTHMHIDHSGKTDLFPMTTTAIVAREELASAAGGLAGWAYPSQDVKHMVDRAYTKDAAWLIDGKPGDVIELLEGVAVQIAGGHSAGSLNILVETDDGIANLCGDVIYSLHNQCREPFRERNLYEPRISGNTIFSERDEKRAMKNIYYNCRWLVPNHDRPVRILENQGKILGNPLAGNIVPGPLAT
ncbi:MBL fold metallo-hydrolase [Rhizobium sp. NZLR11]|uniref:MBL fold metallo-hydrolase n=1 Tax=Rhizobium sp. NZLR11 TaxID=2731098 RepID=UPI001C831E43|nr:MBL fold metallo-hydrolase [Rhizobium sp. NZLR11]MBX5210468.1 MBL fold metallo-hydrolase [Rhizobium sp. NZLR11]